MSQNDFSIANQTMPSARTDINSALQAAATWSSGATAPSTTYAQQAWVDTSATPWLLKVRNAANDAWITVLRIDDSDDTASIDAANVDIADAGAHYTGTTAEAALQEAATLTQGQHTIWIPAVAMVAALTNGAAPGTVETTTNKVLISTLDFDTTTSESAQFAIQMPKGWDEGTLIAQFVWSHPSTATNFGVRWGIQAVSFANDDALDTAFGTEQEVTDTGGTTDDLYISPETAAMTVAGSPAAEEYVVFKVYRDPADASDNLAVDARLHGVKLHYTTDANTDD